MLRVGKSQLRGRLDGRLLAFEDVEFQHEMRRTATGEEWDPKPAHFAPLLDGRSVPTIVAANVVFPVVFNVDVAA